MPRIIKEYRKKVRVKRDFGMKDLYKAYKKSNLKGCTLDEKTYKKILKECNKVVLNKILLESETFKMPYRLGEIRIKKTKQVYHRNFMRVDWAQTKESGMAVYHLNEHRNGFRYRFWWKKTHAVTNQSAYTFIPCRKAKRTLAAILKNKPEIDYYER